MTRYLNSKVMCQVPRSLGSVPFSLMTLASRTRTLLRLKKWWHWWLWWWSSPCSQVRSCLTQSCSLTSPLPCCCYATLITDKQQLRETLPNQLLIKHKHTQTGGNGTIDAVTFDDVFIDDGNNGSITFILSFDLIPLIMTTLITIKIYRNHGKLNKFSPGLPPHVHGPGSHQQVQHWLPHSLQVCSNISLIPQKSTTRWLCTVKKNYREVNYHNWRHAFNVCQLMFAILTSTTWWNHFGEVEVLASFKRTLENERCIFLTRCWRWW